jgi:hypothetical protein
MKPPQKEMLRFQSPLIRAFLSPQYSSPPSRFPSRSLYKTEMLPFQSLPWHVSQSPQKRNPLKVPLMMPLHRKICSISRAFLFHEITLCTTFLLEMVTVTQILKEISCLHCNLEVHYHIHWTIHEAPFQPVLLIHSSILSSHLRLQCPLHGPIPTSHMPHDFPISCSSVWSP